MRRLVLIIATGCGLPWMDRYLPDRAPPRCSGPAVSIGSLVDTSGVSAPYMAITGPGGSVCSAVCEEVWIEVWIASDALCTAAVGLTATVPSGGLFACYGLSAVPDADPWSATCRIEVSGAPVVPRSVVW